MEENLKIETSETTRGKEQNILNKKYKFNYSYTRSDNKKIYRCTSIKHYINVSLLLF